MLRENQMVEGLMMMKKKGKKRKVVSIWDLNVF